MASVSRDITDAIHAELPDVDADPELRGTYASTDNVLRLLVDLSRSSLPPQEALPPPAAVDYAREFVRRGLPLDSLLRAFHIGQAAMLRIYLEENMSPLRAAQRLCVHENTITNRIRAAQELLPHSIEHRSPELQVALRLLRLAQ